MALAGLEVGGSASPLEVQNFEIMSAKDCKMVSPVVDADGNVYCHGSHAFGDLLRFPPKWMRKPKKEREVVFLPAGRVAL